MNEQPPYEQPPYDVTPPPQAPPPQPPARDNTQLFGILGIVLAVCCGPLGILFGYLSMQEARKHGQEQTLGKIGFWLGIVLTALGLIFSILGACLGAFGSWNWNDYRQPYDY